MHEIVTARLILRMFRPDDLDDYHRTVLSDPKVMRWLASGKPVPKEQAGRWINHWRDHWDRHGFGVWAIIEKASNQLIGDGGLAYAAKTNDVEVLYALGKAHWNRGYATELAKASLRYGFETLGLEHIIALAFSDNKASQRVMVKAGMRYAGPTSRYYDLELECYRLARAGFRADDTAYDLKALPQ